MEILWLAIVFYSIGLGLILHFKPALMFNENGTWKEFGYQRPSGSRYTMFPFWLFAVAWAFASYALAAGISWIVPAMSLTSAAAATFSSYNQEEEEEDEEEEEEEEVEAPPKRGRGRPKGSVSKKGPKPGYYVVDPKSEGGLRKYIYYGEQAPPEEESR